MKIEKLNFGDYRVIINRNFWFYISYKQSSRKKRIDIWYADAEKIGLGRNYWEYSDKRNLDILLNKKLITQKEYLQILLLL